MPSALALPAKLCRRQLSFEEVEVGEEPTTFLRRISPFPFRIIQDVEDLTTELYPQQHQVGLIDSSHAFGRDIWILGIQYGHWIWPSVKVV